MERLTIHTQVGTELVACKDCYKPACLGCDYIKKAFSRLAYYEDLEEQGRLVVLPCKVGDTVWANFEHHMFVPKPIQPTETTVHRIKMIQFADGYTRFFANVEFYAPDPFYDDGRTMLSSADVVIGSEFGSWDRAFLTREEAEAALKG